MLPITLPPMVYQVSKSERILRQLQLNMSCTDLETAIEISKGTQAIFIQSCASGALRYFRLSNYKYIPK